MTSTPQSLNIKAPTGGFQSGGWYWDPAQSQARQYVNGSFGDPTTIHPESSQPGAGQPVNPAFVPKTPTTPSSGAPSSGITKKDNTLNIDPNNTPGLTPDKSSSMANSTMKPTFNSTSQDTSATLEHPTSVQATSQAIQHGADPAALENARKSLGSNDYIGLCERFVEKATKGAVGLFSSAIDAWRKQSGQAQTNFANLKPGDSIYFAPDKSNGYNGHTGVYAGGGQFISATNNGVKQLDINDWIKQTGQQLLGFIANGGGGAADGNVPALASAAGNMGANVIKGAENVAGNVGNWLGSKVKEVSNAVVPQAYAAEKPVRKTLNVSNSKAASTPEFVNGTPEWVKDVIRKASEKYSIPTALLSALIKRESNFNPDATSPVGAQGIAQFMPATAQGLGVDTSDPISSIMGAAKLLRGEWDKFGKPELALAAYNAGGGAVGQYGGIPPYKETQNYVKGIMADAGDIHQSAAGPTHEFKESLKKDSAIPKVAFPNFSTQPGITMNPEDRAILTIRQARPNIKLSDEQIRVLYNEYGPKLLSEL